ncbi:MAG: hypothetical protein H0V27_07015 [Pyrinomonadaceae bacterium]|nr:hypothetical protein [Pyrinomonadaceae bacterium]
MRHGGKRTCLPEECGGTWGYEHFLKVINDPDDAEYEKMLEWAGGSLISTGYDCHRVCAVVAIR